MGPLSGFNAAGRVAGLALGLAFALATAMPAGAGGDERYARAKTAYDEAAASGDQDHPGYDRALVIWQEMAADGDARAMYHIGMMYMFGLGSVGIDQQTAMQHVRAGAEGGYPVAQSFMGWVVETGDGTMAVTGDEIALAWWRKGAEGGHCTAVRRMSRAYRNGELGLARDAAKADAWAAREDGCFKN
jgi:TPR repeat protein